MNQKTVPIKLLIFIALNIILCQLSFGATSKVDELLKDTTQTKTNSYAEGSFWKELRKKASNSDNYYAVLESEKFVADFITSNQTQDRIELFECNNTNGLYSLSVASRNLIRISLSNKVDSTSKRDFQSYFRSYEKYCPQDLDKGKRFLDELALMLSSIKSSAMFEKQSRNNELNEQIKTRQTQLLNGNLKPSSSEDAAFLLNASNGVYVINNTPYQPDLRAYLIFGTLKDWDGDNLLVKWGSKFFLVKSDSATIYIGDTKKHLRQDGIIKVVGRFTQVAKTPTGIMAVFNASYISDR